MSAGPDSMSAEGKFFLAVDHLTRMTWRWGESCGIDDVSWDDMGDSYNQSCREDHKKARNAVRDAFHAAVAEAVQRRAPAPSTDSGEAGLREALARDRAYRDGLRAGFQMGEHGEAARYEAIRANLDREITEAAKAAREAGR